MITTTTRLRRVRTIAAVSTSALVLAGVAGCSSDSSASASSSAASEGAASSAPASSPAASSAPASSETASAAGADGMKIQFINPLPSYPTWKLIGECMKEEADALGADFTESGSPGQTLDATAMIQQVQTATVNGMDGIITFPASEGFGEVLKQAQAEGVVTGTIYGPEGPDSGADFNAGPDWAYIGGSLVDAVAAQPGDHVLGLVAAADTGLGKLWLDAVKAAAAEHDNVTIAGEVYTGDDAAKALPQVTALLTAHPDVTDIVTHMGTTTPGAVAAIKAKGLLGKTFLVAGGHDNGGTEAMEEGTANLMLMQDVCSIGKGMVDGVVAVHNGEEAPVVPIEVAFITKDEVQGYLDNGWV